MLNTLTKYWIRNACVALFVVGAASISWAQAGSSLDVSCRPTAVAPWLGMVRLFNGTNLDGWLGDTDVWSVKEGAITGDTKKGGFLLYTKNDFANFRLNFRSRLVSEDNHLGVAFRGKRETNFGYGGALLVIPPDGGMWDYITNKTPPREKFRHDPPFDAHEWHQTEVLANLETGEVQVAVDGFQTTKYNDADPTRHRKGPIGLQLHGGASVVQYKDIFVETNPRENRLITLKP